VVVRDAGQQETNCSIGFSNCRDGFFDSLNSAFAIGIDSTSATKGSGARRLKRLLARISNFRMMQPLQNEHPHKNLIRNASPFGERLQLPNGVLFQSDTGWQLAPLLKAFCRGKKLFPLKL
jgi:hypothetical protein